MTLFKIAWRSIEYRGLGSTLSILSMALGVMLVVAVLSIHSIVSKSFSSNSSFGYNIIVGAKGGSTQLTLNTVFYLSKPTGNIPYEYYLAFRGKEDRQREFANSIAVKHNEAVEEARRLSLQQMSLTGGSSHLAALGEFWQTKLAEENFADQARLDRGGILARHTQLAIPLALGDYWRDRNVPEDEEGGYFRVVGTTREMFTELELNVDTQEKLRFAKGRPFDRFNEEHGYFEAVLGSQAAKKYNTQIGSKIFPTHGDPNSPGSHIHEEQGFTVVGILEPTGTPHDRAVYINLEGFLLLDGHTKPVDDKSNFKDDGSQEKTKDDEGETEDFVPCRNELNSNSNDPSVISNSNVIHKATRRYSESLTAQNEDDESSDSANGNSSKWATLEPLPIEQREVTAILIRSKNDPFGLKKDMIMDEVNLNLLAGTLDWSNYRPLRELVNDSAEAANPVKEVTNLLFNFIDPIRKILLLLTTMICVVSGISILVGIYNSMNQRRHEIAVMRALGASRTKVTGIMLLETIMLAIAGGFIGWIFGHLLIWIAGRWIEAYAGVQVGFFTMAPIELILLPSLLILAVIVGLYPAVSAYRTDVAKSLGA